MKKKYTSLNDGKFGRSQRIHGAIPKPKIKGNTPKPQVVNVPKPQATKK